MGSLVDLGILLNGQYQKLFRGAILLRMALSTFGSSIYINLGTWIMRPGGRCADVGSKLIWAQSKLRAGPVVINWPGHSLQIG